MKTKVEISDQVLNFVRSLAPEPRRSLRLALRGLEDERGDIKQLEGEPALPCPGLMCRGPFGARILVVPSD
jgi:hypothetical protein